MERYQYLSHALQARNPSYGKYGMKLKLEQKKSINKGDSCTICGVMIDSHMGTHVDCPSHFFPLGKKPVDFEASYWLFKFPQVIRVNLMKNELLVREKLSKQVAPKTDLLLFQSGWTKQRHRRMYCLQNPGIHPSLALWLRRNFRALKAVGFDWISASAYQKRDMGRLAHQIFLNPNCRGKPILIIEDMKLGGNLRELKKVFLFPQLIDAFDSAPCTAVGVFRS